MEVPDHARTLERLRLMRADLEVAARGLEPIGTGTASLFERWISEVLQELVWEWGDPPAR